MRLFVCSNPRCLTIWDTDPHGHCPQCIEPIGIGYSCAPRRIEALNTERRDKIYAALQEGKEGRAALRAAREAKLIAVLRDLRALAARYVADAPALQEADRVLAEIGDDNLHELSMTAHAELVEAARALIAQLKQDEPLGSGYETVERRVAALSSALDRIGGDA